MAWFRRTRKALTAFRRYADDTVEYPPHQPLAPGASGFGLVYQVNSVYLEAGQGGNSCMRGFGALLILFGFCATSWGAWVICMMATEAFSRGFGSIFYALTYPLALFGLALSVLVTTAWIGPAFFAPVDIFTRYDRKRGKVWVWHRKQPLELDWNNLVPLVRATAASAHLPNKLYRGMYAEFDESGAIKQTRGVKHVVQVGPATAGTAGVLPLMEYVRRYMETDLRTLPPVLRPLRKRPPWWAMFNFGGLADDWHDHFKGRELPAGLPWTMTILFVVMFPVMFPLQITNYLALLLAPCPKWPKDWLRMHQQDLKALSSPSARPVEYMQAPD